MLINGIEFEIDLLDANEAERIEEIFSAAKAEYAKRLKELRSMTPSQSIREQCNIVFDTFDRILGEGAHEKIFGERVNLTACLDTLAQFAFDLNNARVSEIDALPERWKQVFEVSDNNEPAV